MNFKDNSNQLIARQNPSEEKVKMPENLTITPSKNDFENPVISKKTTPEKVSVKNAVPKIRFAPKNQTAELSQKQLNNSSKKEALPKTTTKETKSDFIALSYAANSESGQIVRVKVPRSMMVSLGVTTNVEKISELVTAEVIVGEDGSARAIRFVQ